MRPLKRTIHFDMHTQKEVYDVGSQFDAAAFAQTLYESKVKYITFFARCNRGYSYYPTKIGICHPSLNGRDMLGEIVRECHKHDIGVTAYVNAVLSQAVADAHPEWTRSRLKSGNRSELCFNTGYINHLESEAKEIFSMYPDLDGYFLDCIGLAAPCKQKECIDTMLKNGLDPDNQSQLLEFDHELKIEAARRVRDAVPAGKYFFCNGIKELQDEKYINEKFNTHYEVESVPGCGSWGYDCFPTLISYNRHFYNKVMYMAGRFQIEWTDFGGLRPEAALEYDAFTALAFGGQITIGDCMHPRGTFISPLMKTVKKVYSQIETVEKWTDNAKYVPEIGVYCTHNKTKEQHNTFIENLNVFKGAQRVLAELKYQFDFVDRHCDLSLYKVLILPDNMTLDKDEQSVISEYLKNGGNIISTGFSALNMDKTGFALPQWAFEYTGIDNARASYFTMDAENIPDMDVAIYNPAIRMKANDAENLANYVPSYPVGNVDYVYAQPDKPTGESVVARNDNVTHISFSLFTAYEGAAYPPHKYLLENLIKHYLPQKYITCDLPTYARATLTATEDYTLLHILSYCPERRGVPVVEEAIDLYNKSFIIKTPKSVKSVFDAQTQENIDFTQDEKGIHFNIDKIPGHRMIVLQY